MNFSHLERADLYVVLNRTNHIIEVGGAWDEFAFRNGSFRLIEPMVLMTPLTQYIADPKTAEFTERLVRAARKRPTLEPIYYRCDAPGLERTMALTLSPVSKDGLIMSHRLLSERSVSPQWRFYRGNDNSSSMRCSFCNRLSRDQEWLEPKTFFAEAPAVVHIMPVRYTICSWCETILERAERR
jgi:hypothetical protein